jgi:hypothetical protein
MAPLAMAHETANGIDFNLNVMKTSPSRISQSGFLRSPNAVRHLRTGAACAAPDCTAVACKGLWPGAFELLLTTTLNCCVFSSFDL